MTSTGAKDYIPSSFSPKTGYLYIPAHNTCMDYMGTAVNYIAGTPYLGASVRMYPGPGGDLAFYGTMDGWFRAVDDRSGKVLWQFKTGSGIIGDPITFTGPGGKQYIAIYSGIGGWMGAVDFPSISADDPYAALGVVGAMRKIKGVTSPGGALYVFSE